MDKIKIIIKIKNNIKIIYHLYKKLKYMKNIAKVNVSKVISKESL